ncbi:hypothetical protein DY000_02013434 [Brassica cretica]|uniref:DUF1985 domain-containing protein n=1 Tax=Brassica cretica TaxID=69181 RepID=A0ABQ7CR45_BRACR|nr:hypothetical protein DY000_02013434 [Brassica cretica]
MLEVAWTTYTSVTAWDHIFSDHIFSDNIFSNCLKMDLPELPPRMFTLVEEPAAIRSISYHFDDTKLFKALCDCLTDDEYEDLKASKLGVFIKFKELKFGWTSRLVHFMLCFQLDIKKKFELWSLVASQPTRFSLIEFEHLTGLNGDYIKDLENPRCEVTKDMAAFWEKLRVDLDTGPSIEQITEAFYHCDEWSRDDRMRLGYLAIYAGYIEGKKVAFKVLMDSLKAKDLTQTGYTVDGFIQVVQVWAYYAMPELGANYGSPIPNRPSPLLLAYRGGKRQRKCFKAAINKQVLMDSLKAKDLTQTGYTVDGFIQVVQVWAYYAMPELGANYGSPVPNRLSPLLLAYKGGKGQRKCFKAAIKIQNNVNNFVRKDLDEMFPKWDRDVDDPVADNIIKAMFNDPGWKWTMDCWQVSGTHKVVKMEVSPGKNEVSPVKTEKTTMKSESVVKEESSRPRKKARKGSSVSGETLAAASDCFGMTKQQIERAFKDISDAISDGFGTCLREIKLLGDRMVAVEKKVGITKKGGSSDDRQLTTTSNPPKHVHEPEVSTKTSPKIAEKRVTRQSVRKSLKMDLPELPPRMFTLGEEPAAIRSISYHSDDTKLFKALCDCLTADEYEDLKASKLGVFIKFKELEFGWTSRLVHFMLCFQLDIKKKFELWSLVASQPARFSLIEFEHLTSLNCDYIKDLENARCEVTKEMAAFWEKLRVDLDTGTRYIEGKKFSSATPTSLARLVMDLEKFENYPWGRVAFKVLMDSLKAKELTQTGYTVDGPSPLLLAYKGGKRQHKCFKAAIKKQNNVNNFVRKDLDEMFPKWDRDVDDPAADNIIKVMFNDLGWKWTMD